MRVNGSNQFGLRFTQDLKDRFYQAHSKKYFESLDENFVKPYKEQFLNILSDEDNKNLLFTKSSIDISNKIKIDKFEPKSLKIKQEKKLTFLMGGDKFYRVMLKNDEVFVLLVKRELRDNNVYYINYTSFKIFPLKDMVIFPNNQEGYMTDNDFTDFLKLLIFVEYSELEEVLLKPKQSFGTKKEGKYLNESDRNFIIVDSSWNKIIKTDNFGVIGHFRWQPIGSNKEGRKLIYIREYLKNGYIRKAKNQIC